MPFQSEKQRRYLWANEPEIARDWADTYGSRIEKNDGGIMRVKLATGMSPMEAQARGLGAQHHGSTNYAQNLHAGNVGKGGGVGFVPGIGIVKPQTQSQIAANQRAQLLAERKDKKEKESIFKKIQRKAITWDLKKRLQRKTKSPTYDPEAAAYEIFDEDTETLQDRIDRANLPFGDPDFYSQSDYTKNYGVDTTNSGGGKRGYMGYPSYEEWFAAQSRGTGVTEVAEVAEVEEDVPSTYEGGVTMKDLTHPEYYLLAHGGRIPAAYGGIMDSSTGRRAYGWGSIGDIFGGVAKAAKKVLGSKAGKIGLTALAMGAPFGGGTWFGSGSGWGKLGGMMSGDLKKKLFMNKAGNLSLGKAAVWASPLLAATKLGDVPDDVTEDFDHDLLKKQYADEILRIKKEARERALDQNEWNYLGVPQEELTYPDYKDGGRIGLYAGGQSIPSDYTMEDAMMTTTQDKLGGITDVMKQADLFRAGDVGQFYAAQGGRIGYDVGGDVSDRAKMYYKYIQEMKSMGLEPVSVEEFNKMLDAMRTKSAQGGRIRAQEGGLMDLGGMEKDYRQEGGFVPLGGEEKADDVPARLSKNEFVFTADAVRAAGGGDIDQGAEVMENVMENLEQGGRISEESQGLTGAQEMFGVSERLSEVV